MKMWRKLSQSVRPKFCRVLYRSYRRRRPRGENHNDDPIDACVFSRLRATGVSKLGEEVYHSSKRILWHQLATQLILRALFWPTFLEPCEAGKRSLISPNLCLIFWRKDRTCATNIHKLPFRFMPALHVSWWHPQYGRMNFTRHHMVRSQIWGEKNCVAIEEVNPQNIMFECIGEAIWPFNFSYTNSNLLL